VRGLHRHDVADLRRIEQRGDTRHEVLAEGRRRAEHMGMAAGPRERGDLRREHRRERVGVRGHVQHDDARHAG
jgi:hypothetical protein